MAKRDKKGSGKKKVDKAVRAYVENQRKHINRIYKKHIPTLNKIFKDHNEKVSELYERELIGRILKDKVFSLSDHSTLSNDISELQKQLQLQLNAFFTGSITSEWISSNSNADNLVKAVFPSISKDGARKYYEHNDKALKAFLNRNLSSDKSRTISGRVWKITNQYRRDIEDTLSIGIQNGDSAVILAKRLNKYLKNPSQKDIDIEKIEDKKVRNELQQRQSRRSEGQGVYRSSYKNALRLTANETNLAYRNAEAERIKQFDFVVGFEVKVSNSHQAWLQRVWIPRHKGRPEICDILAGKYPKDFVWNSWHPQCKCMRLPILKSWEEIQDDNMKLLMGEEITNESINAVNEMPSSFKSWTSDNSEKVAKSSSKPYFWDDNKGIISRMLKEHKS